MTLRVLAYPTSGNESKFHVISMAEYPNSETAPVDTIVAFEIVV
jgi:hypothetical protein